MPKKYYWTRKEEARLRDLWEKGIRDLEVLSKELKRPAGGIEKKVERLGLVVVKKQKRKTTTTVSLGRDILTHEQALKILVGAIEALRKPDQDKLELQRLRILVDAIHTYDSVLEKFEGWVQIEERLLEISKKIEQLKAQKVPSK